MSAVIYGIRTNHNGKVYIGSSREFNKRTKVHINNLKNGKHHNLYLQRVYDKYGIDNLEFFVIEYVNIEDLFPVEEYYIDCNRKGYNIGSVGGGDNLSNNPKKLEIVAKISKGLNSYYKTLTKEEKQEKYGRLGESNSNWKGGVSTKLCPICNVKTIGSRASTCIECKDVSGVNNPFYGKKHSQETKQKLSKINKGKKHTDETKQKLTGENSNRFKGYYYTPWGVFPSSSLAQKNHEYLLSATIHRWCMHSEKTIVKQAASRSKYLRELEKNPVGLTYRDIGFWFEPKQP